MEESKLPRTSEFNESQEKPEWDENTYALAQKLVHKFDFLRVQDREDVVNEFFLHNPNLEGFSGRSKWQTWFYACFLKFAISYARKHYKLRWKKPPKHVPLTVKPSPEEDEEERSLPQLWQPCPFTLTSLIDRIARWREWLAPEPNYIDEMFNPDYVEFMEHTRQAAKHPEIYPGAAEWMKEIDFLSQHILQCEDCICRVDEFSKDPEKVYNSLDQLYYGGSMESVQEVLDLQKQLEEKKKSAIERLLKQQKEISEQLAQLGYKASDLSKHKGQRVCSNCGESGHNIRRCSKPKKAGAKIKPKT
jgi:hypothetical protein